MVLRGFVLCRSFIKAELIVVNVAGLTINMLTALAWGLLIQWLKRGEPGPAGWAGFSVTAVGRVELCYGLVKGLGQFGR